jgi:hypothetical protein
LTVAEYGRHWPPSRRLQKAPDFVESTTGAVAQ